MKVKPLLTKVDAKNFINQYLSAVGIQFPNMFLHPDGSCRGSSELYLNINDACYMLHDHIKKRSRIAILCDEDADGCCSATIVYSFLQQLGVKTDMVFHKVGKSHGLQYYSKNGMLEYIIQLKPGLLIIPDASADAKCAKELHDNNIDCIILDHHKYDFSSNSYSIVVNCLQQSSTNQCASGTLVCDKFVERYCEIYGIEKKNYDDLVAMSIATDVMDLRSYENRDYVYSWLKEWKENHE